eukprot:scaffold6331_cov152-Amphora_coffeaeformis.AAC.6
MNILPAIFEESNVAIVSDNAKSHAIVMSPHVLGDTRVTSKERSSRWECTSAKKDHVPVIKSLRASSSATSATYESKSISLENVHKPIRRRSLDHYNKNNEIMDRMKEMSSSLSSMDGVIDEDRSSRAACLLSMALDSMDLLDVGLGDMVEIQTLDATVM